MNIIIYPISYNKRGDESMHSVRGVTPEGKKVNIKLRVNKKYERSPTITEFSEINQSENSHFCKSDNNNSSKNRHGVLLFTNCYRDPIRKTSNDRFENYISSWGTVICTDQDSPDFMEGVGRIDIRKGTDEVAELHDKIFNTEDDDKRREYLKKLSDYSQVRLPLIIYRYRLIRRFHLSNIDDAKEYVKHITTDILNKNVGCGFAVRLLDKNHQIYKNSYREIFQNFIKDENRLESPDEMVERYFSTPHAVSLLELGDHEIEVIPLEKVFSGKKTTRYYLKKNNYKMIRSLYTTSSYGSKVCHVISKPFRFRDEYTGDERLLVDRVFSMSSPIGHPMRLTVDGNCNMTMAGENPNGYDYSSVFKAQFPSKRIELKRNAFIYQFLTSGTVDGFANKQQSIEDKETEKESRLINESLPLGSVESEGQSEKVLDSTVGDATVGDAVTESGDEDLLLSDPVTQAEISEQQSVDFKSFDNEPDKIERVDEIKKKAEVASETTRDGIIKSEMQFDEKIIDELTLPNREILSENTGTSDEIVSVPKPLEYPLANEGSLLSDEHETKEALTSAIITQDEPEAEESDYILDNITDELSVDDEKSGNIASEIEATSEDPDEQKDGIELEIDEKDSEKHSSELSENDISVYEADYLLDIEDGEGGQKVSQDAPINQESTNDNDSPQLGDETGSQDTDEESPDFESKASNSEKLDVDDNKSRINHESEEEIVEPTNSEEIDNTKNTESDHLAKEESVNEHSEGDHSAHNDIEETIEEIPLSLQELNLSKHEQPVTEKKDFPLVFDDLEQYEKYISSSETEDNINEENPTSIVEESLQDTETSNEPENESSEETEEVTSDEEPTGMAAYLMGFQ